MRVSTKGRYGLRALVDLAEHDEGKAIPIREISERQNISEQYLEQLFATLRKAKIVKSVRGAHGGYMLNYDPEDITVADVITTLEGPIAPVDCVIEEDFCNYIDKCVIHGLWSELADAINGVIENMTLADLRDKAVQEKQREEELEKEKLEAK
ncbi:MAG: AsnC family transcriptional regulator [Halanaerobium sp. 4-GBenrich]|jgi:Rrf2 family protein|uniref:BadM/Rrf2 family transcriptional regulator n=1 Tax=Halanaerobium congolense TaxID=54121 RepID=A0A1G6PLP4_9FIRM|nr:Rrf2 family transcriptional regulator [Halanaerobium congolense]KXS48636.1 MAG: AsnC family transcriptional regulator [Halanaerobium sp. T82-1]ODS49692.1 MAG: AsnC family transcriptional regulator [Halanaerobium sp. 4-GBenrich]OEG62327.1 MAG: AsnC family transcriptional regulator [Halanaerobium sp. MDAL1]PTX16826.1 BadM/Rrf2 family transcriptional regulator [Halanaerobium congolense]TDP11062.1 BadM/Rrf2 family transcriptional regulator [Halanaerobium congolense]